MFGQSRFEALNSPLNEAFQRVRPLVAVHRGTGLGTIAENTQWAVEAALRQGAEMVEIDVIESTDGEFFLFHDGYEPMHFGIKENIRSLDSAAIRALEYQWCSTADGESYKVATLAEVLRQNPTALYNVDRSWWSWERLLPYLDDYNVAGRVVLKSPVEAQWLDLLAAHPVKYGFAPMVRSHADVLKTLEYQDHINIVGMELLPDGLDHEFASPSYIEWLHTQGLFALVNAINLNNRVPLFCGWDDEISVLKNPDLGWGKLVELGADVIQTDWPGMLVPYRNHTLLAVAAGIGPKQ